jgi:hypothetical protein
MARLPFTGEGGTIPVGKSRNEVLFALPLLKGDKI